jgi:hypothetical protein
MLLLPALNNRTRKNIPTPHCKVRFLKQHAFFEVPWIYLVYEAGRNWRSNAFKCMLILYDICLVAINITLTTILVNYLFQFRHTLWSEASTHQLIYGSHIQMQQLQVHTILLSTTGLTGVGWRNSHFMPFNALLQIHFSRHAFVTHE